MYLPLCWSVLDFWKINLEKSSLTKWIFSLFRLYITPNVLHSVIWMEIFFFVAYIQECRLFYYYYFWLWRLRSHPTITQHVWNVAQWARGTKKSGKKWVQVAFTNRELHLLLESRWSLQFFIALQFFAYIQGSICAQGRRLSTVDWVLLFNGNKLQYP